MENKDGNVIVNMVVETDPIIEKDAQIAKLTVDLDNYRRVALKRLGKLPGDSDFLEDADKKTGLTVEEQIAKALLEKEVQSYMSEKDSLIKKQSKELSELRLALKNRPETNSAGSGSTDATVTVKDNLISEAQKATLTATAKSLHLDPDKFIERFKANLLARS